MLAELLVLELLLDDRLVAAGPRRAHLDPRRQVGDGLVGQLRARRHLGPVVVADRLDNEALVRVARHERGAVVAAFQHPRAAVERQVGLGVPYGRMGFREDLAGAAVFLASADADYVVAQTLNVDGGNWMN